MRIFALVLLLTTPSMISHAGEGMWLPDQLPKIGAALEAAGLQTPPENFANLTGDPMGAIVSLGGCSASFVSGKKIDFPFSVYYRRTQNHHRKFRSIAQGDLFACQFGFSVIG